MNYRNTITRKALGAILAPVASAFFMLAAVAAPAVAQTPEGTVITNTATVSFTDANTNTYSDVTASVNVTVGFLGGIDVLGQADVVPPANTAELELYFDIENAGNGSDTIQVDVTWTETTTVIASVQEYRLIVGVDTTTYASLALLNTYLEDLEIAQGETVRVVIEYTTASGSGGLDADISLEATSLRDANSDTDDINVAPSLTGTINVTDAADVSRLPSGGASPTYSVVFPVYSSLAGTVNVTLTASVDGTNAAGITIVSVNGESGSSDVSSFTYNSTQNITVVYTVANNAAGSTSDITLEADGGVSDDAESITVTIVKPVLTVTKQVFTDAALTTAVSGDVLPGQTLYYRLAVSNTGTAAASTIEIEDVLPTEVDYVTATQVSALSGVTISEDTGTVTVTRATLGIGTTLVVKIEVTVD